MALSLLVSSGAGASEPTPPAPMWDATFEFLYLNANEDQASGGHAAVRIEDDVFHFQYEAGLLRMERDSWADFQYSYRGLQNRSIQQTVIAISRDTHDRLRSAFVRRHLTQSHQIDRLRDAHADHELVRSLTQASHGNVSLPGLGFFDSRVRGSAPEPVPSLRRLRSAVESRHGDLFLEDRKLRAQRRLANLDVRPLEVRESDFEAGALPHPVYPFHARYADSVAQIRAIETLQDGAPLVAEALLSPTSPGAFSLRADERIALKRFARQLETRLVELVASHRPDWGHAMLLGMARLQSMERSLDSGRWRPLDVLSGEVTRLAIGPKTRALLPRLRADAETRWLAAREAWIQRSEWHELAFAQLEHAAASLRELESALAGAGHLRIRQGEGVPRGMGLLQTPPLPRSLLADGGRLEQEAEEARRGIAAMARRRLGYRLVARNCVSELFATIRGAMVSAMAERGVAAHPAALSAEFEARLGGMVEASPVPFVASLQVRRHWRVVGASELPSLRRQRAALLFAEHPSPWVRLRESNTWTSTLYEPGDRDSYFLFFTDDRIGPRPLQGLVNLVAGVGKAGFGVLSLPFDRGRGLSAGLRGALFSLPELAFFNVRKGTNVWLPPELGPSL